MSEEPEGASSPMPAEEEPRGLRARRPQNVNRMRLMQRRMRELQLASEGAFSLLLKLLNMVPPFAYEAVARTIREELGAAPEQVFASFEPRPFASASIGQVHRAQLVTGERVAVKVQRPGIRETMRADIGLMYAAA